MKDQQGLGNPIAIAATGTKVIGWGKRNWKPIAYTVGGLVAAYGIYRLYKFTFPGGLKNDPRKEPAKINNTQAAVIAERLYQAMYAAGTDEDAIYDALQGLNHNDFVKVSNAFGKKSYFYITGEAPVFDWMGADLSLVEWLIQELSISDINELREILPEIL